MDQTYQNRRKLNIAYQNTQKMMLFNQNIYVPFLATVQNYLSCQCKNGMIKIPRISFLHEVHSFNPLNTLHIPYYRCNVIDKYNMPSC